MNWQKVGSGAAMAGGILWLGDVLRYRVGMGSIPHPLPQLASVPGFLLFPNALLGFLISFLYAFARPRLGPGPKTALLMATMVFAASQSHLINPGFWLQSPLATFLALLFGWLTYAGAAYVAGWQYMEKAPE